MRIGRGNRSSRIKPAPVPLCPPQILPDLGSNLGRWAEKPETVLAMAYSSTLKMEAVVSSKTSGKYKTTRRNVQGVIAVRSSRRRTRDMLADETHSLPVALCCSVLLTVVTWQFPLSGRSEFLLNLSHCHCIVVKNVQHVSANTRPSSGTSK
jgi:hypothetical protein